MESNNLNNPNLNKDELNREILRINNLLQLQNNEQFKEFVSYFEDQSYRADENWHKLTGPEQELFIELKSQKLAYLSIIQFFLNLKETKEGYEEELEVLEHPDEIQKGYSE